MDLAATSQEAYALFSAPCDEGETHRGPSAGPPDHPAQRLRRAVPLGWLVGAFYGLILGAFCLGATAGLTPQTTTRLCAVVLLSLLAMQAGLLSRRVVTVRLRCVAQSLTTPALAAAIAGLGALARLTS